MPSHPAAATIRAVLFDYGLVLTAPAHPPAWERMKALLAADEAAFGAAYWAPRHDYDRGALNGRGYWTNVALALGRVPEAALLEALNEADIELWTQPNQPMIDWAASLQARGIPTGILSNLGDALEAGVRVRCPWLGGFDHLTFSHRLRTAKPDLAIYRHAAEGLRIAPGNVLFIDDREDNIAGAHAAGMQTLRYTHHAAFKEALRTLPSDLLLAPATEV